jgi:hypothetical protein
MDINILRAAATVVTVRIDQKSVLKKRLMGEEYVQLSFTLNTAVSILIGDYITVFSKNYYLNTLPNVTKNSNQEFVFDAKFESLQYELSKVQFLDVDASGEFYLMANPQTILNLIVSNLNRVGSGWTANTALAGEYKNYSFSSENCLEVLQRICGELEIEWYLNTKQICMTTLIGAASGLTFRYGKGLGLYNIVRNVIDSKNIITKLYAFGSERNIPSTYKLYSKRLKFDNAGSAFLLKNVATYGTIEAVKIFDDIYPHRTGTISSLGANEFTFIDSGMDFDLNSYLLSGVKAKLHFNTGNLAGYEFEVLSYVHPTKTFVIIKNTDEKAYVLPNATIKPAISDTYVLLDISLPASYITTAETALQVAAQVYLDANSDPRVKYAFEMDALYMEANAITLNLGDTVTIVDTDLGVNKAIRMIYYERSIVSPYSYKVEVSDELEPQLIQRLIAGEEEVQRIIRTADLSNISKQRNAWRNTNELRNMIFGTDDYFDPTNVKPYSIETQMLSVGSKGSQLGIYGSVFEPNFGADRTKVNISAGTLVHFTLEASPRSWTMNAVLITSLADATAYYIYARCDKVGSAGNYIISATQYQIDTSTYYYFLIGILHSVVGTARDISMTYGNTRINGRTITTGKIASANGASFIDLDNNTIVMSGSSISDVKTIADNIVSGVTEGGGVNHCKNGDFEYGTTPWIKYNNGANAGIVFSIETTGGLYGGKCAKVLVPVTGATGTLGISGSACKRTVWVVGQPYVISFWAFGAGSIIGKTMGLAWNSGPQSTTWLSNPALTASWQRYEVRIKWTATPIEPTGSIWLNVGVVVGAGDIYFDGVQITEGDIPTPFAVSPWDVFDYSLAAQVDADAAQVQANTATTNAATAQTQANTAVSNAATAQAAAVAAQGTANTAVTNAATAQTTANTGVTNAATANGLLTDIASDSKLTSVEKKPVRQEWEVIAAELSVNDAQATAFSITTQKTTYDAAFQALATYLNNAVAWTTGIPTWINDASLGTTTTIVGATFRANWKAYYDARTVLLDAIADKAKTLADTAQTQANTATTNAATAQTQANTATTNAATAQSTANTAVTNAATAQTQANLGVTNAATANGLLADIASDAKITPVEKYTIKPIWDDIVIEATLTTGTIPAQAIAFGVGHANFDAAYSGLNTYLNTTLQVFYMMSATVTIVRATWDTAWESYYNQRTLLLAAIAAKAKTLADTAQGTADYKTKHFKVTPTTPYSVGDTWSDGVVLKVCTTALASGAYNAAHWALATTYDNTQTVVNDGLTAGLISGYTLATDMLSYASGSLYLYLCNSAKISGYYGRGLTFYNGAANYTTSDVNIVAIGQIRPLNTTTFTTAVEYGFEVIASSGPGLQYGKHLIRLGQGINMIAGWKIDSDAIYTGTKVSAGYTAAAGSISIHNNGSIHSYNFYINADGSIVARNITLESAADGSGNKVKIDSNGIYEAAYNNDGAIVRVNNVGYAGGTTKYRNFEICNGKSGVMARFDGLGNTLFLYSYILV